MVQLWKACFDFVFRYSIFVFLPPFTTPFRNRFKYLSISFSITGFIRIILLIVISGKRNYETYYIATVIFQNAFQSVTFVLQEKAFISFLNTIDKILDDKYKSCFDEIWYKNKPEKFVKYYTWCQLSSSTLWIIQANYLSFFASEKLVESPIPLYSPFFTWGGGYKIFNMIYDTFLALTVATQVFYADIVTITLFHFADCLFCHLKVLLEEISTDVKENNDHDYKVWIEKHIQILNLMNDLKAIMEPHILVQYLCKVSGTVFCVFSFLEVSKFIDSKIFNICWDVL